MAQVYKPYKITLEVSARSRSDDKKDEIQAISYFDINSDSGDTLAVGWYGELNFLGTIADERISGIRVRQGNILIGDSNTLSPYFMEGRFNHWCVGELYVVSEELIPNARRDGFENNKTFNEFCDCVRKTIASDLANKIRTASKQRNNPIAKTLSKTDKTLKEVKRVLQEGFHSSFEKEQIAKSLAEARKGLYIVPKDAPPDIGAQKANLLEQISELTVSVDESNNYKTKKDISSDFSKQEKKMIQAMLEVLTRNFERQIVDNLYHEFLDELKKKG